MIILIAAEKAFDKVQYPFMIKKIQQSGSRGRIPQYNKGHIQETYSQHHPQQVKTKSFPPKFRHQKNVSTFTTSIQHSIGSLCHSDQMRNTNKRHPNWKGGSETVTVCRWHDRVHRKPYMSHHGSLDAN